MPAELLDGQDRHKLLAAWLGGQVELGCINTGYLLKANEAGVALVG